MMQTRKTIMILSATAVVVLLSFVVSGGIYVVVIWQRVKSDDNVVLLMQRPEGGGIMRQGYYRHIFFNKPELVTDETIENIMLLPAVERVRLSDSKITDRGFMRLAGKKSLKEIEIYDSDVSVNAIYEFKVQRPDVVLHYGRVIRP